MFKPVTTHTKIHTVFMLQDVRQSSESEILQIHILKIIVLLLQDHSPLTFILNYYDLTIKKGGGSSQAIGFGI